MSSSLQLRPHDVTLQDGEVRLRPLTESDWDLLCKWNGDPDVLALVEGNQVDRYQLEEVQRIYRSVSQHAHCFLVEFQGAAIGECWIQQMNLKRILTAYAGLKCYRIDLMIGEKSYWSRGIGTRMVRLLTEFGFARLGADAIFGCDILAGNLRSINALQKNGYQAELRAAPPSAAPARRDLVLLRAEYDAIRAPVENAGGSDAPTGGSRPSSTPTR